MELVATQTIEEGSALLSSLQSSAERSVGHVPPTPKVTTESILWEKIQKTMENHHV